MRSVFGIVFVAAMSATGGAQAQSCEDNWGFAMDGGYEGDAPEAFSPCTRTNSVGVLCIGTALLITYTPAEGALASDPNGGDYWPITFSIGDFVYADYVNFFGVTGEFGFSRAPWDSAHPLFEALQSGSEVKISIPDLDIQGVVSLSGSRGAISQVLDACQSS